MIGELLHRLLWFAVAAAIGFLWVFSEQITGRGLPFHAHGVLGALFTVALATGGYDLRKFVLWYRELQSLGALTGMSPRQIRDVRALAQLIESQDAPTIRSLRAILHESGVIRVTNPELPAASDDRPPVAHTPRRRRTTRGGAHDRK